MHLRLPRQRPRRESDQFSTQLHHSHCWGYLGFPTDHGRLQV